MHRLLVILICLFSFGIINAQESSIDFIIKNLGINVDGHFNEFSIKLDFNDDGQLIDVSSNIKVSSIETGIDSRDEHILEEDYFHEEKFKQITLKSTSIKKKNNRDYSVDANLSIKGKTKQITIPITVERLSTNIKITSSFEINRRDFDVGGGSFVMGKTVKIQVTHYQDKP